MFTGEHNIIRIYTQRVKVNSGVISLNSLKYTFQPGAIEGSLLGFFDINGKLVLDTYVKDFEAIPVGNLSKGICVVRIGGSEIKAGMKIVVL